MAKLPVTQGATRRAYSRAAWQARRRWLATKLMGQQPRRAEPREGKASREQLGTCFPAHGNCSSSGEGKCACLPGIGLRWCGLVDQYLSPQFYLPWIGLEVLRHPSTCPTLWSGNHQVGPSVWEKCSWYSGTQRIWNQHGKGAQAQILATGLKASLPHTDQGQKASESLTLTPHRLARGRERVGIGTKWEGRAPQLIPVCTELGGSTSRYDSFCPRWLPQQCRSCCLCTHQACFCHSSLPLPCFLPGAFQEAFLATSNLAWAHLSPLAPWAAHRGQPP